MGLRHLPHVGWAVVLIGAAYAVAIGPSLASQNADSLIPVFVSLESWSVFYWGQNRFGMLLPLLAWPFRSGFANLLVQNILGVAFLLVGCTAVFARGRVTRPALLALTLICILLSFREPQIVLLLFTTNQSYAPALGCFGLAMFFCRRSSLFPGFLSLLFMLVGAWTNGGVAIFVTLLALSLIAVRDARPAAMPMLIGSVVSLVGHRVLQAFASSSLLDSTVVVRPSFGEVPTLLSAFWVETYTIVDWPFWLVMSLLWLMAIIVAARRSDGRSAWTGLLALAAATIVYGCVMALFLHGGGRHLMAALPLCLAAPLAVLIRASARDGRLTRWLTSPLAIGAAVVWLLLLTGIHRPSTVRRHLIAYLGGGYETKLYARHVAAVTGDYWSVWPVAFAMNLLYERESGRRPVLPVAMRSERLHARYVSALRADMLVAVVPSGFAHYWRSHPDLPPLRVDEFRDGYDLGKVAPRAASTRLGRSR